MTKTKLFSTLETNQRHTTIFLLTKQEELQNLGNDWEVCGALTCACTIMLWLIGSEAPWRRPTLGIVKTTSNYGR